MSALPIQPLPRWTILPGDPPALKNWLIAKADEEAAASPSETPNDQDEPGLREAS